MYLNILLIMLPLLLAFVLYQNHLSMKYLTLIILFLSLVILFFVNFSITLGLIFSKYEMSLLLSTLTTLTLGILGGHFIPIQIMPKFIQDISSFTPNYWMLRSCLYLNSGQMPKELLFTSAILILISFIFMVGQYILLKGAIYGKNNPCRQLLLKIVFKNKALLIFSMIFPVIFYVFFSMMFTDYEAMNKIPIAVIDEDGTEMSQKMLTNLSAHDALNLRTTDKEEAFKLIERNYIEAIFILKEGFQENLQQSNFDGRIQLIYLDKSNIAPAMGDIVASAIITDLAIYKAANTSKQFESKYDLEDLFEKQEAKATN